ncbi:uncharacterized protein LOC129771711 [Toxorhynchites rutilus septentrionalis]|uniref:uncharacterized protein LOC129771711 n=1 Tax=Toxorhynchites rutilus septentrionalis TaxID=329112 RepID=UPI0024787ADB|nr:uncharacterized protein LOC129771711 [Toxorhynchites rutilus septentrionalis]XP_055631644.1 uncharacterized protein LOC129771711 [Toxorhynchites rutilus septentrionalis]XP_055631654.1 uncharacterized protein LOC129771711 [Toxorhynchites rutilus septentrionalis]
MTLYWWTHWFWITVWGVVLIECAPLSSIDFYPSKLSLKPEDGGNKSTYLKRAGEYAPPIVASGIPRLGAPFISSFPPVASPADPTVNSVVPQEDIDDTFASGSLAGTDFGPDVVRYTRKDSVTTSTISGARDSDEAPPVSSTTAAAIANLGRFKKNGTIFVRNEQNITTLKLKNYNRGTEKEELRTSTRFPERGSRLVETLMLTAVVNTTNATEMNLQKVSDGESEEDHGNSTDVNIPEELFGENTTFPVLSSDDGPKAPEPSEINSSFSTDSDSNSSRNSINSNSSSSSSSIFSDSSERDIPDSHSNSNNATSGGIITSDRRIGKILASDFRDFVSSGSNSPNASSYISRTIAFSTQNLQEGIDDQDHPLEDDDYRRSARNQQRLNVGAISGICLASLGLLSGISAALVILYRRYLYLNKPQTLSEPDSSGYIDDSTIRDNSDEMYSLDNDSFLNSLEAMTIQNYWTDNVKHTKL